MSKLWIGTKGTRFVDADGRQVILRGVNLGGDGKLPYPDGGTNLPSDFANHETVSFVGRPFPLEEADEHLGRIAGWGFNLLRLVVTWEAVAHAGPDQVDQAYVEYIGQVCERAQAHGLAVFVDFHQDVWSRMSGGSGAPGWLFAKLGLDFRAFDAAGAANVMQRRYDYANPARRQEDRYPMMSWPQNYRMPVNGILWSAFFAGATLTPDWCIEGRNVQDYLQGQYLGAMRALAGRLRELPNVIGFDSLNEPGLGWIGQKLSEQRTGPNADDPSNPFAGPAWSALDGLKVARGLRASIPVLSATDDEGGVAVTSTLDANPDGISIWLPGIADPFEQAGAWRVENGQALALDEDFFRARQGRKFDPERDFMGPFFQRVAETVREVRPDWLLFAEVNPYVVIKGRTFPPAMPQGTVNAVHWYDIQLLRSKKFDPDMDAVARQDRRKRYLFQLGYMRSLGERINGGSPSLIGEFGTPYDLNHGESFELWQSGRRDAGVWRAQAAALGLMYDTMDALLLSSAQWNYTASNRNDLRIGDGWNQEDLSIFSRDQQTDPADPGSGGRAVDGFCRPYAQRVQGTIEQMRWDEAEGAFALAYAADIAIAAPTEIHVPARLGASLEVSATGGAAEWSFDAGKRQLRVWARESGPVRLELRAQTATRREPVAAGP